MEHQVLHDAKIDILYLYRIFGQGVNGITGEMGMKGQKGKTID